MRIDLFLGALYKLCALPDLLVADPPSVSAGSAIPAGRASRLTLGLSILPNGSPSSISAIEPTRETRQFLPKASSGELRCSKNTLVKTYLILLQRREVSRAMRRVPIDTAEFADIAQDCGVELRTVLVTLGSFDGAIICRAAGNQEVARLLNLLDGWDTDALIASQDLEFKRAGL